MTIKYDNIGKLNIPMELKGADGAYVQELRELIDADYAYLQAITKIAMPKEDLEFELNRNDYEQQRKMEIFAQMKSSSLAEVKKLALLEMRRKQFISDKIAQMGA